MMTVTKHALQAAAIAPLSIIPASVPVAVWSAIVSSRTAQASLPELIVSDISVLPVLLVFGLPVAWIVTFVLGVPAAVIARRAGHASLLTALTAGSAIGVILGLVVSDGSFGRAVVLYAWFSVVTAGTFWLALTRLEKRHETRAV